MIEPIGFEYREPRYHILKNCVFDRWEQKKIDFKDMKVGHECAYIIPKRYVLTEQEKKIWEEPCHIKSVLLYEE